MNTGQTVFRQLFQYLPRYEFNVCVRRYRGIAAVLKDKAKQEETSVNAVILRILKESLGMEKKKRSTV